MIRLHPNGFVQYDLPGHRSLHIWSSLLPQAQKVHTPIHNHNFSFSSTVLCGTLENDYYDIDNFHEPTHAFWKVQGSVLVPLNASTFPRKTQNLRLAAGSHYTFPAGAYHDSHGVGLTATVMYATAEGPTREACVLVPLGMEPDNEFRRDQYSDDILMGFVERVKIELFGHPDASDSRLVELADRWAR